MIDTKAVRETAFRQAILRGGVVLLHAQEVQELCDEIDRLREELSAYRKVGAVEVIEAVQAMRRDREAVVESVKATGLELLGRWKDMGDVQTCPCPACRARRDEAHREREEG